MDWAQLTICFGLVVCGYLLGNTFPLFELPKQKRDTKGRFSK